MLNVHHVQHQRSGTLIQFYPHNESLFYTQLFACINWHHEIMQFNFGSITSHQMDRPGCRTRIKYFCTFNSIFWPLNLQINIHIYAKIINITSITDIMNLTVTYGVGHCHHWDLHIRQVKGQYQRKNYISHIQLRTMCLYFGQTTFKLCKTQYHTRTCSALYYLFKVKCV